MNAFDTLHAAAGPALRAWMDTHRSDVEGAIPPSRADDLRVEWFDLSSSEMDERLARWLPVLRDIAKSKADRDSVYSDLTMVLNALGFDYYPGRPVDSSEAARLFYLLGVGEAARKKALKTLGNKPVPLSSVFDALDETRAEGRSDRAAADKRKTLLKRVQEERPDLWGSISYLRIMEKKEADKVRLLREISEDRRKRGENPVPGAKIALYVHERQRIADNIVALEDDAIRQLRGA